MKKFLVVILSILYMASATGATIHMHYCMDKLVAVGLWPKDKKCANCGMDKHSKMSNSCCKDEYKQVKIDKDQKIAESVVFLIQPAALMPGTYTDLPPIFISSLIEEHPVSNAPPRCNKVNSYILNCVFRI